MAGQVPIVGPYRQIDLPDGGRAPFYVIPFDKDGACTAPRTRAALISELAANRPSHVFLFSHGWNNDWPSAMSKYEDFIAGFARMRAAHPLNGRQFRPVLIGVFWPSAVLVRDEERQPAIAAGGGGAGVDDVAVAEHQTELRMLGEQVEPQMRERFYELAQSRELDAAEASELAELLAPVWGGVTSDAYDADELASNPSLKVEDLVELWRRAQRLESADAEPAAGGDAAAGSPATPAGPFEVTPRPTDVPAAAGEQPTDRGLATAGLLDKLNPRNIIRGGTVLMMKDRAGRVGARGVSVLLADVLTATAATAESPGASPVHLVGHSYGCKVAMSALCALPGTARDVESVLLLQPAMSHLAFAAKVPGLDVPGGYRPGLKRSRQPILATFSGHDQPLTRFFHLAVRRDSDLGEVRIAAAPPSRYSALGGYGPAPDAGVEHDAAVTPGTAYTYADGIQLLGIDSAKVISGHSDINNVATWWMLLDQVGKSS